MAVVVLVGASGSGKTTIARAIAARSDVAAKVFHFDSIGVPSPEEMVRRHGSGEGWQRAETINWMLKLAGEAETGVPVLFEGQTRFTFLAEGAELAGGLPYVPILIDCDDETRVRRLQVERRQPELVTEDMMGWARYLRREAREAGHRILDTTTLSLPDSAAWVIATLRRC
jgi:adenylate kinase family enzyme